MYVERWRQKKVGDCFKLLKPSQNIQNIWINIFLGGIKKQNAISDIISSFFWFTLPYWSSKNPCQPSSNLGETGVVMKIMRMKIITLHLYKDGELLTSIKKILPWKMKSSVIWWRHYFLLIKKKKGLFAKTLYHFCTKSFRPLIPMQYLIKFTHELNSFSH